MANGFKSVLNWGCARCTFKVEMEEQDKAIFNAVIDIHIHDHIRHQRPQTALLSNRVPEIQWSLFDLQFFRSCAIEVD